MWTVIVVAILAMIIGVAVSRSQAEHWFFGGVIGLLIFLLGLLAAVFIVEAFPKEYYRYGKTVELCPVQNGNYVALKPSNEGPIYVYVQKENGWCNLILGDRQGFDYVVVRDKNVKVPYVVAMTSRGVGLWRYFGFGGLDKDKIALHLSYNAAIEEYKPK